MMFKFQQIEKKIEGKKTVDKKNALLSLVLASSSAFEEIKFEKNMLTIWCPYIKYQIIRNENGRTYDIVYLWDDALKKCAPDYENVNSNDPEHDKWHSYKHDDTCHSHYKNKKNGKMSIDELKCFLQTISEKLSNDSNCISKKNPRGLDCEKQRKYFKTLLEEYSNFVNESAPKVIENKKIGDTNQMPKVFFEKCYDIADQYFDILCHNILSYSKYVIEQVPPPSIHDFENKKISLNQNSLFNSKNCLQNPMQSLPQIHYLSNPSSEFFGY